METETSWKYKTKRFLKESWRVLKVTKKPDMNEFKLTTKVSGIGLAIIGLAGFLIFLLKEVLL
jgi:protein transport protein SEC61 subunit gamma and related proteins